MNTIVLNVPDKTDLGPKETSKIQSANFRFSQKIFDEILVVAQEK